MSDAFCFTYFLALLVRALTERELRRGMHRSGVAELPRDPEERTCHRPTAAQVICLFALPARNVLILGGEDVRVIDPDLTDLPCQVLRLMGVPPSTHAARSSGSAHYADIPPRSAE